MMPIFKIQGSQTGKRKQRKKSRPRHIVVKFQNIKEKILKGARDSVSIYRSLQAAQDISLLPERGKKQDLNLNLIKPLDIINIQEIQGLETTLNSTRSTLGQTTRFLQQRGRNGHLQSKRFKEHQPIAMYIPYLDPDSNKLKIDTVMRQSGQYEQWPASTFDDIKEILFFQR